MCVCDLLYLLDCVQAICSVLRTPLTSIDHLNVTLPDPDASKVQWTLNCYNGEHFFPHYCIVVMRYK